MSRVSVRRGSSFLLSDVDLRIDEGERWVVIGPNGAGKTTLLLVASGRMFPTTGTVELLGEEVGAVDMAEVKPRIGWASSAMFADIPPRESVFDVVMTGAYAVSGRWREEYEDTDRDRAARLISAWGVADLSGRTYGTLSEGERKRTLIARALMSDPELLLLDEPGAGLDLGGREDLVDRMNTLALDPDAPTQIVVTHHVEEIPSGFTHALLLRGGAVTAAGPLADVLTDEHLTATFGLPITVRRDAGRWYARRSTV
ncbi:MAG: ABC transporter ATP-binding protein [Actinobacteria bacterium]|nr:ABC transporter ATP-binding protein [Actinomycetota bacterium]